MTTAMTDFMNSIERVRNDASNKEQRVTKAFEVKLKKFGIDDVKVAVELDGDDYIVSLEDKEGDTESIVFGIDEEEGAFAMVLSEQGEENEQMHGVVIDLDAMDPPIKDGALQMEDLKWLNYSVMSALFGAGDVETATEKFKKVIRGGKAVKIPIKIRPKRMSPKQKAALAKNRRKANTSGAKRKRALSNKIRKRLIRK